VESPDDQVYFRQTRASNKAKTRRKTKVNLLSLEQELDINECFFPRISSSQQGFLLAVYLIDLFNGVATWKRITQS
jgi:hypothetical protein